MSPSLRGETPRVKPSGPFRGRPRGGGRCSGFRYYMLRIPLGVSPGSSARAGVSSSLGSVSVVMENRHLSLAGRRLLFPDARAAFHPGTEGYIRVARRCHEDGTPIHSFPTLLAELATIERNTCRVSAEVLCVRVVVASIGLSF